MKKSAAFLCLVAATCGSMAQVNPNYHWVDAYTTQDGRYVQGHYSTDPNDTNRDNYSTYPNINPHTGAQGTVQPDNNGYGVRAYRTSGGDPIWVATSGQVPYGAMMQRRVLTPQERAAREAARQARRERAAAMREYRRHQAQLRNYQRKIKAEERAKERAK